MPDIVTFDPIALRIIEIDTGGDNELEWQEIYSEWKDWLLADPTRMKYPPAFSTVGGDPITPVQNLGLTHFLEGGWRMRPAERNHRLRLVGNCFTREVGGDVSVDTLGLYRVTVELKVSNLVDASVARLDLDQLLQTVYIDVTDGVPGTAEGIGTPTNPVNNEDDAYAIAVAKNLHSFTIHGNLLLTRDYNDWEFAGTGAHTDPLRGIELNGHNVHNCAFRDLNLLGTMTGTIEATRCGLGVVIGLNGAFIDCGFFEDFTLDVDSFVLFANCYAEFIGNNLRECNMRTNATVMFRNYSGGLELSGMDTSNWAEVDLDPGRLRIAADCSGGTVMVHGTGPPPEDLSGGAVTLLVRGMAFSGDEDSIATEVHARGKLARRFNLAEEAAGVFREIE